MKITFIDTTCSIVNYGLRVLASYVKENGHEVKIIFMQTPDIDNKRNYSDEIYKDLYSIVLNSDIVGFSFVSNYYGQAKFLTEYIKKNFNIPVIWGGIHVMGLPDECLNYADMICMGDGEEALLTLLNNMEAGMDYSDTPNIWLNKNGDIIKNDVSPLIQNLNKYPYPFYDYENEYIALNGRILPMTFDIFKKLSKINNEYFGVESGENYSYMTLTSRGCPYSCTYCCNNIIKNLYTHKGKLIRFRSNDIIIGELKSILKKYPFINYLYFFDDDFLWARRENIEEFAEMYKSEIGLPFKCNTSPSSVIEKNIEILYSIGLTTISMGLQTASQRVNDTIYKRKVSASQFMQAAKIINKYKIKPYYDIILDNPLENYYDIRETLRFLGSLPMPYHYGAFSLTFFPGSELYNRAKEMNLIKDMEKDVYDKKDNILYYYKNPYIKFLLTYIRIAKRNKIFSKKLLYILSSKWAMTIFNSLLFSPFWKMLLFLKNWYGVNIKRKNVIIKQ